jgi:hypothetical protein
MATLGTLGEVYSAGWGIRIKCARSEQRAIVKLDRCAFETALSMETLVCTRGRDFPLARIASRLRCPNFGNMGVHVLFDVPGKPIPVFVPQIANRRSA